MNNAQFERKKLLFPNNKKKQNCKSITSIQRSKEERFLLDSDSPSLSWQRKKKIGEEEEEFLDLSSSTLIVT